MSNHSNPPDILKKILQRKAEVVAAKKQQLPLAQLQKLKKLHRVKEFYAKILIRWKLRSYASNGATCFSILMEVDFFQGYDEYLQQIA